MTLSEAAQREIAKLRKINAALMSRVERSTDQQSNAFALFETAIALDHQVRDRTRQLQEALRSLEASNETLFRAKQQAEAASSLKSSVLISVTHDLLQPLNAARLTLSALADMLGEGQAAILAEQVDRSLVTLEDLLRTLLDISRLDAGVLRPEARPVAVASLFAPLAEEFSRLAAKRGLALRVAPTRAHVLSDPLMLRRILQNLLANAVRYTQRGGVLMGCRREGAGLRIEVRDTGPGIPPAQQEAMFAEFQRGAASAGDVGGIGLGLSIVRRFATALGHDLRLKSQHGRGATFSLSLPRAQAARDDAAPEPQTLSYRFDGLDGAKILLVENDRASAEALAALLEKWGCDVAVTMSAADALERVNALQDTPDAIVADLHLDDGATGFHAVERLRWQVGGEIPAIIVTADYSEAAAKEAARQGLELLRKPVRPAEMRSLLSFLLS